MDSPSGSRSIAELLDRHGAALELYAAQWTNSAADCVQEAFIQLASSHPTPEHPAAWLYRVVRNHALNAARSQRRRDHYEQIAARLLMSKQQDQASSLEGLQLLEGFDKLKSEERETVVLRIWSGLTWQEIAELTNTSSSSAQRQYVGALKQLRQYLEPSCLTNPN